MELGKTAELRILTPGEVGWIDRALDTLKSRGDGMARDTLEKSRGRNLRCGGSEIEESRCSEPPTHYTLSSSSGMRLYCAKHWRNDFDPDNATGLTAETPEN